MNKPFLENVYNSSVQAAERNAGIPGAKQNAWSTYIRTIAMQQYSGKQFKERYNLHRELLTDSEYSELQNMRSNYAAISDKLASYEKKEADEAKNALFESDDYKGIYESEEFKGLKENHTEFSVDELKSKLDTILLSYAKSGKLNFAVEDGDVHDDNAGKKTVSKVFANMCKDGVTPEENYEGFKKLTYDLNHNPNEMFDEDGNKKTKRDAEDAVRKFVYAIMGLNENSTKRDRKRAMKEHGIELFEVMEEEIDIKVETGFKESEFFNNYVETRNLSRGDRQEFWTDDKVVLSTTKIAGDHHDFTLQRLGSGESYTVTTSVYGIAVGADIDLYLAGRLDWSKFTDQCAAAFVRQIQNDIYAEMMNAGKKLPAQFQGTGALSNATRKLCVCS